MSRFSTFITVLLTSAITIALTVTVSRWWLVAAVPLTALCTVGIADVTQRHNNILRNYPILGHARFALLAIRPEIQQYFIERDHDGRPFDRDTRALIYARAGGTHEEQPFGTELDVSENEFEFVVHSLAPADLPEPVARAAIDIAERIAAALRLEGLLAVEMFLEPEGRLLVNELAPRPHNSGHWTIDGCTVSQFEQQVRAILDLPLGDTTPLAPCVMQNLLGDAIETWPAILAEPGACLHLYGKREARPGRKMGHVTRFRR